jgi:hypothetical protein
VSEQSALNYLEKWRLEHPGEEDAGAVDDFPGLKELKDEHVDDVKACLENLLLGDGVDAEQREWLETVSGGDVAAAKKKAPAKKKPGAEEETGAEEENYQGERAREEAQGAGQEIGAGQEETRGQEEEESRGRRS